MNKGVDLYTELLKLTPMQAIIVKFYSKVNGSSYVIAPTKYLDKDSVELHMDCRMDIRDLHFSYKFLPKATLRKVLNLPPVYRKLVDSDFTIDSYIEFFYDVGETCIDNDGIEEHLKELFDSSTKKEKHIYG